MPGYGLYPGPEIRRLRSDFPDHLICELHDESGRPVLVATLARRCCPCPADLVTASDPAALRRALALSPHPSPQRKSAR
ncbi:hypothetical protein [Nocardiopsis alborubida]|uniref:Uncharacterized protein n=1 Tax=Nocardiopsis alborubida TaxID=146802 RepID=A0A7X6RR45_9ACTN|nr:hypothetical protein [Nocardiopsis alborubida]NKY99308.1 hypothetical protein [Nocardiopsis alborubida]